MKAKPKAKRTGKPKAKRAGTTRGAQTAQGAQVKQGAANRNGGKSEAQDFSRVFGKRTEELYTGAASFERWGCAAHVLSCGFLWAVNNGAGYDEILERPEMLRAVECLINDPPEIATAFLRPNPNPVQSESAADKEGREWILATFQEWVENDYLKPTGKTVPDKSKRGYIAVWDFPKAGTVEFCDLKRARFAMFPTCLNLGAQYLRESWAMFVEKCGLPEFEEMKKWLELDKVENKRAFCVVGALYDCEYSEEQYFDLNTGESNAPKYGGGGVRATAVLWNFREYLRERQRANGCVSDRDAAADRKPDAANGKPSGGESGTPAHVAGEWATAQGVKNYNGECFSFKGLCLERKPKREKQWADIAAIVESIEPDGAAMLGKNWRGKFSNADDEYKSFTRFIHPLPERGAGWFRLEKEKIAERRKW